MPSRVYACHCTLCQAHTGSAFAINQWLRPDDLRIEGEVIAGMQVKPDGACVTIYGCPNCLSRIYSANDARPMLITLRAGTRDDSKHIIPEFHIWTRSKQSWVAIPEDVLTFVTQVSSAEEWTKLTLTGRL